MPSSSNIYRACKGCLWLEFKNFCLSADLQISQGALHDARIEQDIRTFNACMKSLWMAFEVEGEISQMYVIGLRA